MLAFRAARHAISGLILGFFTHPALKGCLNCRFSVYSLLPVLSKLRCVVKLSFALTYSHRTPLHPAAPLPESQFQDLDLPGASWDKARRFPVRAFLPSPSFIFSYFYESALARPACRLLPDSFVLFVISSHPTSRRRVPY